MRIGELAKETGKSVAALRYYEQIGLLPIPQRTKTGYWDYLPECPALDAMDDALTGLSKRAAVCG